MRRKIPTKSVEDYLNDIPDEVLQGLMFSVPWQYDPSSSEYKDSDGFPIETLPSDKEFSNLDRVKLQKACWDRSINNPQVNTNVRRMMGRMTGFGFGVFSEIPKIQNLIDEIELDYRNRLWLYYPKYAARSKIEGELFLLLTVHENGFVEVDFIDPILVEDSEIPNGIIFHPRKKNLPLFYSINWDSNGIDSELIPSIYIARNPNLARDASKVQGFSTEKTVKSKDSKQIFRDFGGFCRFIVSWDQSFITQRNISHLRTTIKWLNHYENLKLYEIDHKKSSGAYLWVVEMEDPKVYRRWLSLTDEERRATGIMAKKTPGSTLVLPPGMKLVPLNPNLPKISDSDTDILAMVSAGLNEPEDVTMGSTNSTFSSVKASRGPMSDRDSDEICWFEQFLRYELWSSIFYLCSSVRSDFPSTFQVKEAVGFKKKEGSLDDNGEPEIEPVIENVVRKPEQLIEISFPTSEVVDMESRARALLGVKHGSVADTLHIPRKEIARKLGFASYYKLLLQYATEKEKYPKCIDNLDQESLQERTEAEPSPDKVKKKPITVKKNEK